MADPLPRGRVASLRAAPLTYDEVGATLAGGRPAGYTHLRRAIDLPPGASFDGAADRVLTWRMHEGAGLRVAASAPRAAEGEVVEMRLGVGPLSLRIPCRVVAVVDEPHRAGFAYGTLPGHPEQGEEAFLVVRRGDRVSVEITAFSRPATWAARAAGPAGRAFQALMTQRYLRAADPG